MEDLVSELDKYIYKNYNYLILDCENFDFCVNDLLELYPFSHNFFSIEELLNRREEINYFQNPFFVYNTLMDKIEYGYFLDDYSNEEGARIDYLMDNLRGDANYICNTISHLCTTVLSFIDNQLNDKNQIIFNEIKTLISNELKNQLTLPATNNKNKKQRTQKTYIIKEKSTGLYKIGKSVDPQKRERTLLSQKPDLEIIKIFPDNIEIDLHRRFSKCRVRGEWFNLTKSQLFFICNHFDAFNKYESELLEVEHIINNKIPTILNKRVNDLC